MVRKFFGIRVRSRFRKSAAVPKRVKSSLQRRGCLRGFSGNMKRFLPLALLLMFTACTTTLTNLTPRTQQRNPNGLYPVEVMWDSQAADIKKETIKGFVI